MFRVDLEEMIEDDHHHGARPEENGKPGEFLVGDHIGLYQTLDFQLRKKKREASHLQED